VHRGGAVSTRALLSRSDGTDEPIDLGAAGRRRIRDDELLWVDLESPAVGELSVVREALGIGDAALERLATVPDEPHAVVHDDAVEIVVKALGDAIEDDPVPLQVLIGEGWVVTNHGAPVRFLAEHWEMVQDQREVGRLSSLEFLTALLDWHLDAIFDATEALESEVDRLDEAALRSESNLLERLVRMRKRLARFRRILYPHRQVLAELARPDFLPDGGDPIGAIHALIQRFDRAQDAVNNVREMLIGTFDVHMTRVAQRTNDVMRVLTLASVVLLPSVVVAGVMGMNFRVDFFDQPNLFWVVVAAMAVLAVATVIVARWRRWL
jgi:magnesium transporter